MHWNMCLKKYFVEQSFTAITAEISNYSWIFELSSKIFNCSNYFCVIRLGKFNFPVGS